MRYGFFVLTSDSYCFLRLIHSVTLVNSGRLAAITAYLELVCLGRQVQKLDIQRTSCVDTAILVLLSESRLGIFLTQVTNLMSKGVMEHQSWDGCLYFMERPTRSRCRDNQQFGEKLSIAGSRI